MTRLTRNWCVTSPEGDGADRVVEECRTTAHVIAKCLREGQVRPEQWDYAKRDLAEAWSLRSSWRR